VKRNEVVRGYVRKSIVTAEKGGGFRGHLCSSRHRFWVGDDSLIGRDKAGY
jgi:hypothetical protein